MCAFSPYDTDNDQGISAVVGQGVQDRVDQVNIAAAAKEDAEGMAPMAKQLVAQYLIIILLFRIHCDSRSAGVGN